MERFVVSGERVPTSLPGSSHWVWLLGCSFALDRDSEYKLHCAVKDPRTLGEILTICRRRNHNRIDSLSSRISKLAETPTPSHIAPSTGTLRSTMIRGQWERWRRKEPANRRGYKNFFLNLPTETVRHGQVLSCLPPVSSRCLWKTSSFPDLSLYSGDRAR